MAGHLRMVDLAWIIAGIFIAAIVISLTLAKIHGTFAICKLLS